jgi:hypothetical protein
MDEQNGTMMQPWPGNFFYDVNLLIIRKRPAAPPVKLGSFMLSA